MRTLPDPEDVRRLARERVRAALEAGLPALLDTLGRVRTRADAYRVLSAWTAPALDELLLIEAATKDAIHQGEEI